MTDQAVVLEILTVTDELYTQPLTSDARYGKCFLSFTKYIYLSVITLHKNNLTFKSLESIRFFFQLCFYSF